MQEKGQKRKDHARDEQTKFNFEIPAAILESRSPTIEELAGKLAEHLGVPLSPRNLEFVRLGLASEIAWGGLSPPEAARVICHRGYEDLERGVTIDKFYFEDAKWRRTNANQRIQTRLDRELAISARMRRQTG